MIQETVLHHEGLSNRSQQLEVLTVRERALFLPLRPAIHRQAMCRHVSLGRTSTVKNIVDDVGRAGELLSPGENQG